MKKINKKAFTLIELLVVVLIIGILAAIAVPQYQLAVEKSKFVQLKTMTENIIAAQEAYYLANNQYATNFQDLDIILPSNSCEGNHCVFDWGSCVLQGQVQAYCNDTDYYIYYQFHYINGTGDRGARYCISRNERAEKICKLETNSTFEDGPGYKVWTY